MKDEERKAMFAKLKKGVTTKLMKSKGDIKGQMLEEAYLRGAYLREADLSGAYLYEADLWGAYLRGTELNRAVYSDHTAFPSNFIIPDSMIKV